MRLQRPSAITAACIAFAIALWFGATFALLGDTGKFSDDYIAHLINPLTGEVDWSRHPWTRWPYFWRPLHLVHVYLVNTISFARPWIGHLELALVHLGVCGLLYRVLTVFGVQRFIAWSVAVLFMVCPLHAEAVLWTSASCNAISCVFLLWLMLIVRWQAAEPLKPLRLGVVFLLAFVIACWYEPAAGGLLALPMVARAGVPDGLTRGERLRRVWPATLAAGAACAAYVALLVATAPGGARGGEASLVPLAQLPARIAECLPQIGDALVGRRAQEVVAGAMTLAGERSWSGVIVAFWIVLSAAGLAWFLICGKWAFDARVLRPARSSGSEMLLGCGVLLVVGAIVPVVLTKSPSIDLRTLYVPLLGIAMVVAGAFDVVHRRVTWLHPKVVPIVLGVLVISAVPRWVTACIGFQIGFREQSRLDASIVNGLRALGDPPAETVFLPLIIDRKPVETGHSGFDEFFRGAFELPSTITPVLRHGFRRLDVSGVPLTYRLGGDVPIHTLARDGFELRRVRGGAASGSARLEWSRTRAFVVESDAGIRPVVILDITPLGGETFRVRLSASEGAGVDMAERAGGVTRVRHVLR